MDIGFPGALFEDSRIHWLAGRVSLTKIGHFPAFFYQASKTTRPATSVVCTRPAIS